MQPLEPAVVRPVTVAMQRMLVVASTLVFIAGVQLFVLTEQTDRYFAWTIKAPLTAAFLGAGYWASCVLEYIIAREKVWANARASVPAVWMFTTLTLIATLLHLDIFRTESAWAWAWFAIYAGVPVVLGVILIQQLRVPGGDPPRTAPLPAALRFVIGLQLVMMLPLGIALFVSPLRVDQLWPWPLTELTARAIGAWLIGWSVVEIQALWENDWRRVRVPMLSLLVWGTLVLIALARYSDTLDWNTTEAWVFVLFAISIVAVGLFGAIEAWYVVPHGDQPTPPALSPQGT
jgi:hypothetical protein